MARNTWYRLDNVGKFYSSEAGNVDQTVFRFSSTLTEEVNPEILQQALEKTIVDFPGFNVCLRSGMFWHYLEQSNEVPVVHEENLPICFGLHVDAKSVLFRVCYYKTRISFEVSHMVSDGRGALNFFKTLLFAYLQKHHSIDIISNEYDGSDYQKSEDSFDKYYERNKPPSGPGKAISKRTAKTYRLSGWRDAADPTYLEYHLPVESTLGLARSFGVSLTSLIITAVVCAIRAEMSRRDRHRAIYISIPVDLRQFYQSSTLRNFFGLAFVSYVPGNEDEPFERVAATIHEQLKSAAQPENLKSRTNRMISLEKNPFLRFAPLFMKDFVIASVGRFLAREVTTTVSNIGQIHVDECVASSLHNINAITSTAGTNLVICSFGNDLSISISTVFKNLNSIKEFCRFFSHHGIEGYININKTNDEKRGGSMQ